MPRVSQAPGSQLYANSRPCVQASANNKVRSQVIGARMDLSRVRASSSLEIVWQVRVVKAGASWEIAPVRPALCLRQSLTLVAGQVQRLL